jgi:mycoredoxin
MATLRVLDIADSSESCGHGGTTMTDRARPEIPRLLGADWCPDCRRSKALLDRLGVAYEFVDLEADPDRYAEVEAISGGRSIPTILFPEGDHLVEPDDATLEARVHLDLPRALAPEEARIRGELAADDRESDFLCHIADDHIADDTA